MIYNSTILLRGVTKPVPVSQESAKAVQQGWEDDSLGGQHKFKAGGVVFMKSDIKFIDIQKDKYGGEEKDVEKKAFYDEERKKYAFSSSKSAEDKANNIDMFEMVFTSMCGEKPTQEVLNQVIQIQKDFFVENKKRVLCDFQLLRPLIKMYTPKITAFSVGSLRVAEMAIFRDMQLSGQIK